MKNKIKFTAGEKEYEMYFTIGDMRNLEREIGKSLISIINLGPEHIEEAMTIDVDVAAVRYGLHDKQRTDEEIYDIIQQFCDDGHNVDQLSGVFFQAIVETGIFYPTKVVTAAKNAEKVLTQEKKSEPLPNGSKKLNQ
jgi:hypothetical protein